MHSPDSYVTGAIITGYVFADSYCELYVNGTLVDVDAVPFTPFNSSVVRFRVMRPKVLDNEVLLYNQVR